MKISAPALIAIMITGLVISILQAATQVNEQTLSFIPKIVAMTAATFFTAPWIIKTMIYFTTHIIKNIEYITK